MFELPQAKRVRREDLNSPSSSRESSADSELERRFKSHAAATLGVATGHEALYTTQTAVGSTNQLAEDEEKEDEVAFRLFAPTQTSGDGQPEAQRLRLRSPTPLTTEPGFVHAERPPSYYFTGDWSADKRDEYEDVAVTGEDILARSHSYWPGSAYTWKITVIPARQNKVPGHPYVAEDKVKRKTRLGKKSRIKKRERIAAKSVKAEQREVENELKERAEREKKAKKNRDKKLKKRARDKAKKVAAAGDVEGGGDDATVGGAVSGSDSDSASSLRSEK